jgi:hypothetical protein
MKEKHMIIYAFHGINDPLLKGLMLEYIIRLREEDSAIKFHLISHEHQFITNQEKSRKKEYLKAKDISWHPVISSGGKFLLLKRLVGFLEAFFIVLKIKLRHKPKAILGFLSVAGGYSYILSRVLNLKLVVFCFEPHSNYMADFGLWKKDSLAFRLLHYYEKKQIEKADYITVPTEYSLNDFTYTNIHAKKYVVPISIDTGLFSRSSEGRKRIREHIGCGSKTVIIYTGKFGGIYYEPSQVISFFKKLLKINRDYFLYIITPSLNDMNESIRLAGVDKGSFFVSAPVAYEELPMHLSAADIGLIAVPGYASQKYRTPVKTAIYLACGLPYIVNKGVAEDDLVAIKERVGIVMEDLESDRPDELDKKISDLLRDPDGTLQKKCIDTAKKYRDISISLNVLKEIISDIYH